MTWRTRRTWRRGAWWAAAAIGAVCVGACSRAVPLAPGEEVVGELAPEGQVTYGLRLAENDYARVRVMPAVTDRMGEVAATVSAPDDRPIAEATGIRNEAGGVIAWVASGEGIHRLRVTNPDPTRPLPFRVTAEDVRPARPGDRDRAGAEGAAAEAARRLSRGERERAVEARTRALELWRRVGETESVIGALLDLADVEYPSDPDRAIARCDEAINLGVDAPSWRIEALKRKGLLLGKGNDCAGAQAAFEEAKKLAHAGGDLAAVGSAVYEIGSLQRQCRSLDLAEATLEEALDYGRRVGDDTVQAHGFRNLAMMARWRGDFVAANEQIKTAVQFAEASGDRELLAAVLHEYGNIERSQGRLVEAREHYQRCLELNESVAKLEWVTPTLVTLGIVSLDLRRSEEARHYLERALKLGEDLGELTWVAEAERELGATYERMLMFDRAEKFYRRSLATAGEIGRENSIAAARFRLGNLLVLRERFREAVPPLTAALERQQSFGDHRGVPRTLRALGFAYGQLGEPERAVEFLSEALSLQREQDDALGAAWTLHRLAQVQIESDPIAARRSIEEAIDISRRIRRGLNADSLRVDFFEGPRALYDVYVDLLLRSGDVPAAFAANEEGRAQALLDLLAEARVDPRGEIDPEIDAEAREIESRLARSHRELAEALATGSAERARRIRDQFDSDRRRSQQLEEKIRRQSRRYRELSAPTITTLDQVQSSLPVNQVLLEYWLGVDRSYVFVVSRERSTVLPLPRERDLTNRIERFRATLVNVLPPASFGVEAHSLYKDLVAPALESVPEGSELIIIPDGRLNLVPFEALLTAPAAPGSRFDDLAYLVREMEISYAPSATVLAALGTGSGKRWNGYEQPQFVAFADPDYGRPLILACPTSVENVEPGGIGSANGERNLPRLRGSRPEVRRIARRYEPSARVYVGAEATEDRVVSDPAVSNAKRLHFAVHGVVCESRPEDSGLIFTLDENADEDGILEVREIFDLRLAADLVVLSACDTGTGKLVRGEGVVGLSRAFFYSGVPSLVVSLWQVPDRSTADLMASFYRGLDEGENKAEALRRAKLGFLDAGGSRSAPLYWAPFILVGSRSGAVTMGEM